ncbi:hypothetical protein D3C87_1700990 [compost metagenome]
MSFFFALRGKVSGSATESARQCGRNGQSAQAGRFGVQIVAPRSIIACAKSPGRSGGVSSATFAFMAGFEPGRGASIAKRREMTRSTLPSITAACRLNAMAATAADV